MKYTKSDILKELKIISKEYKDIKLGLAGSYVRGEETDNSDIDIVFDTDALTIEQIESIKKHFDTEVDVIQIKLLEQEDIELDKLMKDIGLEINNDSAYKCISRRVHTGVNASMRKLYNAYYSMMFTLPIEALILSIIIIIAFEDELLAHIIVLIAMSVSLCMMIYKAITDLIKKLKSKQVLHVE